MAIPINAKETGKRQRLEVYPDGLLINGDDGGMTGISPLP
jgi:hypothetical protein